MQIITKITIGGINSVRKGFKGVEAKKHVARVIGIARSADLKPSENMGDSFKFGGEFRAWNEKGEEFAGPVCYLPEPAQGMLNAAVIGDKSGAGVQFGFDFFVRPDEKSAVGYVYETHPLMDSKPSDALAALAGSLPNLPKLAHEEKPQADAEAKPEGEAKPDSDHKAKGRK